LGDNQDFPAGLRHLRDIMDMNFHEQHPYEKVKIKGVPCPCGSGYDINPYGCCPGCLHEGEALINDLAFGGLDLDLE
jgi:hypothetical protein